MISNELISLIRNAERPLFIWGAGMREDVDAARDLAGLLRWPVATTWGAIDLVHHDSALAVGGFGTHGTRAANFAVQNADLIISLGCRLDTKATGTPQHFARGAKIVMVDVDQAEIDKMPKVGRPTGIGTGICATVHDFIEQLGEAVDLLDLPNYAPWYARIQEWKARYNAIPKMPGETNPYEFMKELSKWTTPNDIIVSDTGCALGWLMQAFPFKGERFIHAFNQTPMGYGLPAAIGAALATGKRVVAVCGDGSVMMSLPELATISRWNLNVKIILVDNQGHAMCRQTQRQWLGGNYYSTSETGGLGFPNWSLVAKPFDIRNASSLRGLFSLNGPALMELEVHPDCYLSPQAKYGQPLEDADPQLPWEELCEQMIVPPIPRS